MTDRQGDMDITLKMTSEGAEVVATVNKTSDSVEGLNKEVTKLGTQTEKTTKETQKYNKAAKDQGTASDRVTQAYRKLAAAGAALGIAKIVGEILDATTTLNKYQASLEATTGSSERAAAEWDFLRETADALGLDIESAGQAFVNFTAAAEGTALEGEETQRIFRNMAGAAVALGLSNEELEGSLLAVQQIMSKGKVSAEELRGQLGERFAPAWRIAAEAIGVTSAELDQIVSSGRLMAEDFLPLFADALEKNFGDASEAAGGRAEASFNRFKNALFELGAAIGNSGLQSALAWLAEWATAIVERIIKVGQVIGLFANSNIPEAQQRIAEYNDTLAQLEVQKQRILNELDRLNRLQEIGTIRTEQYKESTERVNEALDRNRVNTQVVTEALEKEEAQLKKVSEELEAAGEGLEEFDAKSLLASKSTKQLTEDQKELSEQAQLEAAAIAMIEKELADLEAQQAKLIIQDADYIRSLESELELLGLTNEEAAVRNAVAKLSIEATDEQIERVEELTRAIFRNTEQNTEWADSITLVAAGFRSMNSEWSTLAATIVDGIASMIVQFKALESIGPWKELTGAGRLSAVGSAFGLVNTGVGLGRQVGGQTGGILGGAASGALAGFQLAGGNPLGAILGGLAGALFGGLFGGGEADTPNTRVFLRTSPDLFRGTAADGNDYRAFARTAFGGIRFSAEEDVAGDVRRGLLDVIDAITILDQELADNLAAEQIAAVTDALTGFASGGDLASGQPIEQAVQRRFGIVFDAIDGGLGEVFRSITGGLDVSETLAVANAINQIIGQDGVFADVEGTLATVNVLMEDFARVGESLPQVLARISAELALINALGLDQEVTTGFVEFVEDTIEALGGLESATEAVDRFVSVFSQTQSGLEAAYERLGESTAEAFEAIGLVFDPDNLITLDQFNRAFQEALPDLTPEQLANWVRAGLALADFTQVAEALGLTTEQLIEAGYEQLGLLYEELQVTRELSREIREALDVETAFSIAISSSLENLNRLTAELQSSGSGWDGTVEGLERIRDAAVEWQGAALGVLSDILSARQRIEGSTGRTLETLRLQRLTEEEQLEFYTGTAEDLARALATMSDPGVIAETVAEINRLTNASISVSGDLAPERVDELIAFLESVNELAGTRLDLVEEDVINQAEEFRNQIEPILDGAVTELADSVARMEAAIARLEGAAETNSRAADQQEQAANTQLRAASTPVEIVVTDETGDINSA